MKTFEKVDLDNFELKEDEVLLKLADTPYKNYNIGFIATLNKDGTVPKAFLNWRKGQIAGIHSQSHKIKEVYRNGWEIIASRNGQSTFWLVLKHPFGFLLEITDKFIVEFLTHITLNNGKIENKLKFNPKKNRVEIEGFTYSK